MNPFKKLSGKSKPKDAPTSPSTHSTPSRPTATTTAAAASTVKPPAKPGPIKDKPQSKSTHLLVHKQQQQQNQSLDTTTAPAPKSPHPQPHAIGSLEQWNASLPDFESLQNFKDVSIMEKGPLFQRKLKACQRMYVWRDGVEPSEDTQWDAKETKRKQLIDLVDFINQNSKIAFVEDYFGDIVEFAAVNMFRGFLANPTPTYIQYDPEEDEPLLDPSWPHLQFVMEVFLRFVVSPEVDPKIARKFIDQAFITKLLELFDSEDVRERDFLKTILHRIYGKFMQHRPFIRKSINDVFYHFVYNTGRHNGIAEMLEILGSIINGFALPLKEEHKLFLRQGLMPLHKAKFLSSFHNQLSYCITQFCEKDHTLATEIILGFLRFWPQTNSPKEVLYLQELEEILELTQPAQFQEVLIPLFQRINRCIMSQHFQVAERTLFLWHNEFIVSYITQNVHAILPVVFPALMHNTKGHWNTTVYQLTIGVVKMFSELDALLFEDCAVAYVKEVERESQTRTQRDEAWHVFEATALAASPSSWRPPEIVPVSVLHTPSSVLEHDSIMAATADHNGSFQQQQQQQHPHALAKTKMVSKSRYGGGVF